MDVAGLHCDSAHRGVYYTLQLRYLGLDDTAAAGLHHQTRELVDSRKFASLTSLGAQRMTYACRLIDQAGVYEATITSSHDATSVVATSNRVTVQWSDEYRLRADRASVLPCHGALAVEFTQPSCSRSDDKVRLYVARRALHATTSRLLYVTERRATTDQSSVSFECRLFNSTFFSYCFKYISTANNGAVHEQTTLCLPTNNATGQSVISSSNQTWNWVIGSPGHHFDPV